MRMSDAERFQPETLADWAAWLAANHTRQGGVWVVNWRSPSGRVPVSYEEMVCEALCCGWIDGQVKVLDELRGIQWWAPRRARSGWSASNKARVAELERQ